MSRFRLLPPLLALLALPSAVSAQTKDQRHVAQQSAVIDSARAALAPLDTALTRNCATKSQAGYLKAVCGVPAIVQRYLDALRADESAFLGGAIPVDSTSTPTPPDSTHDSTVVVIPQPGDTATKPDTSAPPPVITPGPAPGGITFAHPYAPPANGAILAELPRDSVGVAYPQVSRVVRTSNLQAALDSARAGDEIRLPPGTQVANIIVRRAVSVVVRTDVPDDGDLWHRMTPARADSLNLATITTADPSRAAIAFASNSGNVRFALVRITSTAATLTAVVRAANGETSLSALPHDVHLDRVVVDATTGDIGRCVYFDVVRGAVTSSTLLNCHSKVRDAQGVLSINGAGPFRIENDSIEASAQDIASGGGGPSIPGLIPSDWVIRGNWLGRPLRWKKSGSTYGPDEWEGKTGIESKNTRRMLIEGNTIANVWPDAQVGFAVLLKSTDQDLNAPWSQTSDVTIRNNRFVNVANGFNLAAVQQGRLALSRVAIYDNKVEPFGFGGGIALQLLDSVTDVVVLHNTFASAAGSVVVFSGPPTRRTVISGNILPHGAYGVKGTSTTEGTATISKFMPGGLFESNVVYPAQCSLYPAGTLCALPSTLPLAKDGAAIGANLSLVP